MNMKWFASLTFFILIESAKSESQDIRVKLCGREFIRMVVTSCGSSRFKRHAPDSSPLYTKPDRSLQNLLNGDLLANQKWTPASEEEQWKEFEPTESMTEHPASHTSPSAEVLLHSTTVRDVSTSSRTRRDVGPAGVCCTSGCTMSELIQYC
ncbi:insulin-like 3 (Leydig cell) [Triplophysa rosa]|uniref:Insulin-like 3 n=1 Tax=Triplophysa rosa TaxID=992332 RepID=A0A9W7WWK1_TRIRA|nr:insulin-like 3 (Leydig cell) [Triplophysa rosa]KAI7809525.1 relaxin 3c precursor [Triplophysa rosa]